ncbi:cation transporter [Naegleria gruberi]|uniref:Cation transporter n=1 Tax=Naegleria gruberi TaxID=5762 RepID=D2V2E7_NAEGR|nr:cation transporter [Naegleria gruberi]EFC49044.1 cation transporter [Naegleria gruberi]|eukprot:XP_002681788.1 cation transporter [Naegleria gruberi strain NEG-M]
MTTTTGNNIEKTSLEPSTTSIELEENTNNNNTDNISIRELAAEQYLSTPTDLHNNIRFEDQFQDSVSYQGSAFSNQPNSMMENVDNESEEEKELNEIEEDMGHEKVDRDDNFGFKIDQFLRVTLGTFYFCKRSKNNLENGGEQATTQKKPKWLYRYYAPIHIAYIIFCGFLFGTLIYVFELNNPKANIPYIDALLMSFANVCLAGFVTQPIVDITVPSQVSLFLAIVSGGPHFTLIPILLIKIFRARKRMFKLREEEAKYQPTMVQLPPTIPQNEAVSFPAQSRIVSFFSALKQKFTSNKQKERFPHSDIEYSALLWLHSITFILVVVINSVGFLILGGVFAGMYNEEKYMHGKSPFWLGLYIAVSAFNNCGSTLLDENLGNFVDDWVICMTVGILIILGNVLFPLVLRYVLVIIYKMSSKRKVVFKYILEKHHHLSPYLFPGIQTTIYGIITILLLVFGIVITLACDWGSPRMADKSVATRILIALFHPISARTGGFNSIDLFTLSFPTLAVYIIMMYTKPQMACSLRENAYKIVDMVRHINDEKKTIKFAHKNERRVKTKPSSPPTISVETPATENNDNLESETSNAKNEDVVFVKLQKRTTREQEAIVELEEEEKRVYGYTLSRNASVTSLHPMLPPPVDESNHASIPRMQKFKKFAKKSGKLLVKYLSDFWFYFATILSTSNMWMIIMVFIISIAENNSMKEDPKSFSIFFILFEVISAYANSGLTVGKDGSSLAYCGFWTTFSKVILCIVLVMGRHRGFYGTLIDLEPTSYDQDFKQHSNFLERRSMLRKYKKEIKKLKRVESRRDYGLLKTETNIETSSTAGGPISGNYFDP